MADASNVITGAGGKIYRGPFGTAGPTTHNSALNVAFVDQGYLTEDGWTEERTRSTEKLKAWGGVVVRESVTEAGLRVSFALMETNKQSIEAYYATSVNTTSGQFDVDPTLTGGSQGWVIDTIDGSEIIRAWIPAGEIVEVESIEHKTGSAAAYGVTIAAYPAAALTGKSLRKWSTTLIA